VEGGDVSLAMSSSSNKDEDGELDDEDGYDEYYDEYDEDEE
jgi:hypothetical protein